jgi:hypothetical protein
LGARTQDFPARALAILPVLVATAPIALLFGTLPPAVAAGVASVVILRMLTG